MPRVEVFILMYLFSGFMQIKDRHNAEVGKRSSEKLRRLRCKKSGEKTLNVCSNFLCRQVRSRLQRKMIQISGRTRAFNFV